MKINGPIPLVTGTSSGIGQAKSQRLDSLPALESRTPALEK